MSRRHTLNASPENIHWGVHDAALPPVLHVASGDTVGLTSWAAEGRSEGEREYPAGEGIALVEDADTDHWFYNRSDEPVKVLICDFGLVK